jgi:predicted acyl esterase
MRKTLMDQIQRAPLRTSPALLGALLLAGVAYAQTAQPPAKYPDFPSETPTELKPAVDSFEYVRREAMIPMRDGVRLHTVILVPNGAKGAPILLTRTPYDADALTTHEVSAHLGPTLQGYDNATEVIVEGAKPIAANQPLLYHYALPTANHVFLPGHRIMVQVQSSWFPLYDRNPQTFVPNIFWAKPADYQKATQRIYHAPGQASFIELPVVRTSE